MCVCVCVCASVCVRDCAFVSVFIHGCTWYHIISMGVCVCALRGGHRSDSTSRQTLLLSLGDGNCRPKRGCSVSWHP